MHPSSYSWTGGMHHNHTTAHIHNEYLKAGTSGSRLLYLALQLLGGHIAMPGMLTALLTSKGYRSRLVVANFCFAWIFNSVVYSLTVYSPQKPLSHYNSFACMAQALLIHPSLSLVIMATLILIVNLWLAIKPFGFTITAPQKRNVDLLLIAAPYLLFFIETVVVLHMMNRKYCDDQPHKCEGYGDGPFYCLPLDRRFAWSVKLTIFHIALSSTGFLFEGHILWKLLKRSHIQDDPDVKRSAYRLLFFSLFRMLILISMVSFLVAACSPPQESSSLLPPVWVISDYAQASSPLVAFFMVVSKRAILRDTKLRLPQKILNGFKVQLLVRFCAWPRRRKGQPPNIITAPSRSGESEFREKRLPKISDRNSIHDPLCPKPAHLKSSDPLALNNSTPLGSTYKHPPQLPAWEPLIIIKRRTSRATMPV